MYTKFESSLPETVNTPGVVGSESGVHIPKLGLQHLAAGVVETTGVLAMIFGPTASF